MGITHFKGNRSPSLSDTIKVDGVAFDLTTSTVKFKMRAETSATLKIDAAAVVVSAAAGTVRYDFTSADVDTAADYLGWWEVTLPSGKTQDTPEFEIAIIEHVAPTPTLYVQMEEFKTTINMTGERFADDDIERELSTACRDIDKLCGRRFYPDADALQVRYYTPGNPDSLQVDDIVTITSLKTDPGGDGTFEETWTLNSDYVREPLNASADSEPWTCLCRHPAGNYYFPANYPRSVEVTGKFGWSSAPSAIKTATTLLAHRRLKRAREAPFGVAGFGLDGAVVRIGSLDPDVMALVAPYSRVVMLA